MIRLAIRNPVVQELLFKAFIRSCSRAQVIGSETPIDSEILVTDHLSAAALQKLPSQKIIVFGSRPSLPPSASGAVLGTIQNQVIHYSTHALTQNFHLKTRAFERYDFTNEWNNLGYGRIESGASSPWSLADAGSNEFAILWDEPQRSILWVNRPTGTIDGFDWRMIEDFISDYRSNDLVTLPVLSEIPAGYQSAVTMRIDCDEHIASGRPLFELYRKHGVPFSMAIKTQQNIDQDAIQTMKDILAAGGAIVTHSHTHAPNWGGSREAARWEADKSLEILQKALPEEKITYAVSPFHQNPLYAVEGIHDAGIEAFVGGIIHNDPEFLMARSGEVPLTDGVVSHSEHCMLHGDCYHDTGNSIQVYVDAFENAVKTETFFGYLDHPFSAYQYGWHTEEERLAVHQEYLSRILREKNLWFANLKETLDFLCDRSRTQIKIQNGTLFTELPRNRKSKLEFQVRWRGSKHTAPTN